MQPAFDSAVDAEVLAASWGTPTGGAQPLSKPPVNEHQRREAGRVRPLLTAPAAPAGADPKEWAAAQQALAAAGDRSRGQLLARDALSTCYLVVLSHCL